MGKDEIPSAKLPQGLGARFQLWGVCWFFLSCSQSLGRGSEDLLMCSHVFLDTLVILSAPPVLV